MIWSLVVAPHPQTHTHTIELGVLYISFVINQWELTNEIAGIKIGQLKLGCIVE
jgi:hypothetical protein